MNDIGALPNSSTHKNVLNVGKDGEQVSPTSRMQASSLQILPLALDEWHNVILKVPQITEY